MYVELWGHPFGLASAVLTYNRDPELHVALMRTMLFSPCTHFYDDHLTVDMGFAAGSGQRSYLDLCSLTGKVLDADKHEGMAASVIFYRVQAPFRGGVLHLVSFACRKAWSA